MISGALHSAEIAAVARALGATEREPGLRNPDSLASIFVGSRYRLLTTRALAPIARRIVARRAPGLYWFAVARTKHVDSVLVDEIARGLAQLVIVGAGYDTRAYRFAESLAATRVYELDLPAVIRAKQRKLARVGDACASVTRLEVDLETAPIQELLAAHGFDSTARTMVICEAVSMFLDEATFARLLRFVAGLPGLVVLVVDAFDATNRNAPDVSRALHEARRIGAPIRFTCPPAEAGALFGRFGLRLRSLLAGSAAAARHLRGIDGRPPVAVAPFMWIADAERI
jgi:methyltransferase (TIGR00027 family)